MAALEVLTLVEGTPQIVAAQSGDTYELPRNTNVTGNITVTGTVDGRDVAADGTKLDTIKFIVKVADETINSSTTFQDDDELLLAVAANKEYSGYCQFFMDGNATADLKATFSGPAGSTGRLSYFIAGSNNSVAFGTSLILQTLTPGQSRMGFFNFILSTGGTAGNITFQWAQQVSDAGDTKVLKGSTLVLFGEP